LIDIMLTACNRECGIWQKYSDSTQIRAITWTNTRPCHPI